MLPFSIISTYGNVVQKKAIQGIRSTFSTSIMPVGRYSIQNTCDYVNNIGYIYGGYSLRDGGYLNDFWKFDLVNRKWTQLASGIVKVDGGILWHDPSTNKIYSYGGHLPDTGSYNSKMYVYDISTNSWSLYSSTAPTVNSYYPRVAKVNDVVYCWGSYNNNSLYSYSNGVWTQLSSSTGGSNSSSSGMCTDGEYLYCNGSKWEKYNVSTGVWSTMGSYGTNGIMVYNVYDNNIYCVHGTTGNMGLYNKGTDTWSTLYNNVAISTYGGVLFPRSNVNEIFYVLGYDRTSSGYNTVQYLYN